MDLRFWTGVLGVAFLLSAFAFATMDAAVAPFFAVWSALIGGVLVVGVALHAIIESAVRRGNGPR